MSELVDISSIVIGERVRNDLGDIEALASSISKPDHVSVDDLRFLFLSACRFARQLRLIDFEPFYWGA